MERRYAKRNSRTIYQRLDKTMEFILGLADIFETQHPPEAAQLRTIAGVLLTAQMLIEKWYEHVWGNVPDDWYKQA